MAEAAECIHGSSCEIFKSEYQFPYYKYQANLIFIIILVLLGKYKQISENFFLIVICHSNINKYIKIHIYRGETAKGRSACKRLTFI